MTERNWKTGPLGEKVMRRCAIRLAADFARLHLGFTDQQIRSLLEGWALDKDLDAVLGPEKGQHHE